MSAIEQPDLISIEEYLAGELSSPVKHEYLGGVIYAMAGAKNSHNRLATNVVGMLYSRLRGQACQPFNSDTKIRIRLPTQTRFYYPDASVVCRPNPPEDSYQDEPLIVIEVLSDSTRRDDEFEKKDAYLTLPSLAIYALVEQDRPLVKIFRRGAQGFEAEVYQGLQRTIPLPEIATELPLAEIYEGVDVSEG